MPRKKRDKPWSMGEELVRQLAANTNVEWAGEACLILTLEFRRELYDLWVSDPRPAIVRQAMLSAGIDELEVGRDLAHEMTQGFKRTGRPSRSNGPTPAQRARGVVAGAGSRAGAGPGSDMPRGKRDRPWSMGEELVRQLAANTNVEWVGEACLILTLEFRRELYDLWSSDPRPAIVRQAMLSAGIDELAVGRQLAHEVTQSFKRHGRPSKSNRPTPAQRARGVVAGAGSREARAASEVRRSLVEGGRFAYAHGDASVWPVPELEDELFGAWAAGSAVADALDGLGLGGASDLLSAQLEARFSLAASLRTSPGESRREGVPADLPAHASAFAVVSGGEVAPTGTLVASAALPMSAGATVDDVLDAHLVGHRLLSVGEKARLASAASSAEPGIPDVGGTRLEAEALRRRAALLRRLVEGRLGEVASEVPAMSALGRKRLCAWVSELPHDPAGEVTTTAVLGILGISRSSYYRHVGDDSWGTSELRRAERDAADAGHVREAFEHRGFRKGARQVCMLVPRLGHEPVGLSRVRRIMRELGLESGVRGPNPARRAARAHEEASVAPNLLRRAFRTHRPNEVRVTDVTTIDHGDGLRAYGSALMDPVTSVLVAFVVSDHNDLELAMGTLRAGDSRPCEDGGILHSDQGVLYKAGEFADGVESRGLRRSMSKRGNCWDNATVESFFGHFKDECDYAPCATLDELRSLVGDYADYYNRERGMWGRMRMTPLEYEEWLSGLDEEGFAAYLEREEAEWERMRERAAELARRRYGTLGA